MDENSVRPIAIVYCTTKGHTADVAARVARELGEERCALYLTKEIDADTLAAHPVVIFGAPTFGMGDLDRRMQRKLKIVDPTLWEGKTVAFFVMGDQVYHGKTFAGGLEAFAKFFADAPVNTVGLWPDQGYSYEASNSVREDGHFPGLVIDEINQPELTDDRVRCWVGILRDEIDD